MNVAAEALSRFKIRKLVREFRKAIGCEKMEYFPIMQCIEWILANPENGMDFEIVDPGEMQDTYGTTNTEKNVMRIRSDVYEGAVKGRPRDRFTLCHELGHYILHQEKCRDQNSEYGRKCGWCHSNGWKVSDESCGNDHDT